MPTPSSDTHARLLGILASGEAIEVALEAGDADAAQRALQDRAANIAALPPPPEAASPEIMEVAERLRLQGERLQVLTRQKLDITVVSLGQLARATAASDRYGTLAAAPARLDTAPRYSSSL